jgi:hypothetical protein
MAKTMQEMLDITADFMQRHDNCKSMDVLPQELQDKLLDNIDWQWPKYEKFAQEVAKEDDQFDAEEYLNPLNRHRNEPKHPYYGDPFNVKDQLRYYQHNLKGNTLPHTGQRHQRRAQLFEDIVREYEADTWELTERSALPHCMGLLDIWLDEKRDQEPDELYAQAV